MLRRSSATVFGLAVAFGLGLFFSNRPATSAAQPVDHRGRCVGVAATYGVQAIVYRAFEDGTVEGSRIDPATGKYTPWEKTGN
jgi:hypothetical protein